MSNTEYQKIKKAIIRSKRYTIIKDHIVSDGRVLTKTGWIDFFDFIEKQK